LVSGLATALTLIQRRRSFALASRTILGFAQSSEGRDAKCGRKNSSKLGVSAEIADFWLFTQFDEKVTA